MDIEAKKRRMEKYFAACRDRGLRSTVQKREILDAVLDLENHPTADRVFEIVRPNLPELSRTTVYRVLESFVDMGLITKTCHPGSAIRYDPRIEQHHHLVCLSCDTVIDIDDGRLDALELPDTSTEEFVVHDFRVQLRGTCRRCRNEATEGENP